MRVILALCCISIWAGAAMADDKATKPRSTCEILTRTGASFLICRFDPGKDAIRLYLRNGQGDYFRHFTTLRETLAGRGETLRFAMNAGMYHQDRSPVGLFVENGEQLKAANTNAGPGNFHLLPNGVFFIDKNGKAGVRKTKTFLKDKIKVRYATQSGPMLVIDGKIHPRFIVGSPSRKRRNGIGVTKSGQVIFALADTPINFYQFAKLFRDTLKTPNALFLDGTISRIYAPELGRNDPGRAMGPIVAVVAKVQSTKTQ